jgi:hypothetical protein
MYLFKWFFEIFLRKYEKDSPIKAVTINPEIEACRMKKPQFQKKHLSVFKVMP